MTKKPNTVAVETNVKPETDKTSVASSELKPSKAGTSHLTQGANSDEAKLENGVPVTSKS